MDGARLPEPKNPDHFAIVIGIDGYVQLRRLRAAGRDAIRFADWLTTTGGLPGANVKLVLSPPELPTDPLNAEPVERHITRALQEIKVGLGTKPARLGSRLYFYFAGHGFGPRVADVGMLLADAEMTLLRRNIGLQPYRDFFRKWELFDEVIFILDCCRDPVGEIETRPPEFTLGISTSSGALPNTTDFVVMAAAYGRQAFQPMPTNSDNAERRGILTEALLEALKGDAPDALDAIGRVTAVTLKRYLSSRVPHLAAGASVAQDPVFADPDPPRAIVLATYPLAPTAKLRVRIVAPQGLGGELVVYHALGMREHDRRPTADVTVERPPWELLLETVQYVVSSTSTGVAAILDLRDKSDLYVFQFPKPD